MENQFTSFHDLPSILLLKQSKEASINSLINNLKIDDVRDESNFEQTSNHIKNSVILSKVEFGEPKCIDHKYEDRPLSRNQQLIGGVSRDHYIHQIEIPFTGNRELFDHTPEQFSFSSSDRGLILPDSNSLTVYVDLPELNPTKAITEAYNLLSLTMQFVHNNNTNIETWSTNISQQLDQQLQRKREELIRLFPE
jgi:hypothetical protein